MKKPTSLLDLDSLIAVKKRNEKLEKQVAKLLQRNELLQKQVERSGRAEEALKKSEEMMRTLVTASLDGLCRFDYEAKVFDYVSPSVAATLGYSVEELSHMSEVAVHAMVHPADVPGVLAAIDQLEKTGEATAEYRQKHKNGDYVWLSNHMSIAKDEKGSPIYRYGNIRNVTIMKQAEEERERLLASISEYSGKLAAIMGSIADEVWFADTRGVLTLFSPQTRANIGMDIAIGDSVDSVLGSLEILNADGTPRSYEDAPLLRSLKGEKVSGEEIIRHAKTGELRHRKFSSSPVKDNNGTIIGSVATSMDITEIKRVEEALRESRLRFLTLIQNLESAVLLIDADGRFPVHNPAFLRIFNITEDELRTIKIDDREWDKWDVIDQDGKVLRFEHHPVQYARLNRTPVRNRIMGMRRYPQDDWVWVLVSAEPLLNPDGSIHLMICTYSDITNLKQAEDMVRESRAELQAAFGSMSEAIFIADGEGRLIDFNDEFVRYHRFKSREECSRTIADCPKFLDVWLEDGTPAPLEMWAMPRALRGETGTNVEYRLRLKETGETWWGSYNFGPIKDREGRITGGVVAGREVTALKLAGKELRKSEERLDLALRATQEGIWDWDMETNAVWYSPKYKEMLGYSEEEIEPHVSAWLRLLHPEDKERSLRLVDKVMQGEQEYEIEFRVRHKDGHYLDVLSRGFPVRRESDGKIVRIVGTHFDLTERKRMEEELLRSRDELELRVDERTSEVRQALDSLSQERQRLYDVLETMPALVWLLTPDYHVAFANRAAREKFGEVRGRLCYEACFGLSAPCEFCETYKALKTGQPVQWEACQPDGSVVYCHDFPFTDADGSPMILEVGMDITELRHLESQLRQAHKMEALGTLTGGIAHDFNNILAAILGFTEMCLDDVPEDGILRKNLQRVLESSFRARELIRQMLTFSRKTEHKMAPLSITPLVKETAKLLRASIPTTVEIEVEARCTSDTVLANATGLQQIIMNLSTNAAHAMRENGGKLSITLSNVDIKSGSNGGELAPGPYVQIMVKDTGVGMDDAVMKRIFDPFFTTKELGQGTGMGLAVVYGLVKSFGGNITVESEPGKGSLFRVLIPKVTEAETSQAMPPTASVPAGSERVLFVDDEEIVRYMGEALLRRLGYQVTALGDSKEALKLFSEEPSQFDLIITDQTMPGLTGLRLAQKILELRPDMPIILCTGHSDSINSESVKEIGIRQLLNKPLSKRELGEAVRSVLDGKAESS